MANLEPEAPVSQWARGFVSGHMWLEEAWDLYLPEEMEEEMGAALAVLSFFASRSLAEKIRSPRQYCWVLLLILVLLAAVVAASGKLSVGWLERRDL